MTAGWGGLCFGILNSSLLGVRCLGIYFNFSMVRIGITGKFFKYNRPVFVHVNIICLRQEVAFFQSACCSNIFLAVNCCFSHFWTFSSSSVLLVFNRTRCHSLWIIIMLHHFHSLRHWAAARDTWKPAGSEHGFVLTKTLMNRHLKIVTTKSARVSAETWSTCFAF